jgi:hypothetical protein
MACSTSSRATRSDLILAFLDWELKSFSNGKKPELSLRKKMNFTTDLPKKNPVVSYIVASAIRCTK